jgi:pyruvate/2-oxoglutarate dehydrogenase complex dihydrolipoamide acyltransferase (E2) component
MSLPEGYDGIAHTEVRLRARRKAIARNLEESSRIPALTADQQVDMSRLLECRRQWNSEPGRAESDRLSVLALMTKAAVASLHGFPAMNATYTGTALLQWHPVNLGMAVDSPGGLVVPVIRDAATLDSRGIGAAIRSLAQEAREGRLSLEQLQGGTFTISNPGSVGPVLRAEALINPPQVALLGLAGMRRTPTVVGDIGQERIEVRSVMTVSLTFDHRVLDGAEVVRYLNVLRTSVETWDLSDYIGDPPCTDVRAAADTATSAPTDAAQSHSTPV